MANERLNAFLKKLDEREAATRGGTSPGASAASKKEKVNNKRAAEFLKRIGIDEEYYSPVDETDIEPFRSDVQELRKSVNNAQLPSQVQKNQQRYNQLEETGGYLEAFANPQDVGTRKNVFQGNYTLQNLNRKMDLQRAAMGAYENDMAYVQDNTQSYADYQRYLQAAMGDEYAGLRGEMYTYGMDKTDAAPGMTLEDINSEINALVKEITDAKKPKEPMRDPMSGMVMPTAPVDVSAQEARLKELYGMLENKQYISDEEAEEAQKSYFDRFKEDRQAELDAAFEEADRKRLESFKLQQQAIESEDPAEEARLREEAARMDEAAQSMMDETQLQEDAQQAEYDALKPDRNWGQYIGSGVMQGFSDFANAAYQTYDVVLGKPIDAIVNGAKNLIESVFNVDTGEDFRNPLSKWADTYKKVNAQYQTQATEAAESMGGSEAWKVGQQVIGGLVQNVPNTVLAFLTGGASVGAAGMQKAATKAMNAVGNSKAVQAAADMISNPQYWLSFSQTVGNDYNQALEESGDPMKAALYAMLTSVVNAGIEIGASGTSGIQGINQADDGTNIINRAVKAVTGRDNGAFGRIIDSASDEALEELQQGIVSGLAEKVIYDANKQYFSMSDENAIVSPELAKQALVGGITGGLLGGGAEVTNAAVGAYQNAEAQREYARAVEQYFSGGLDVAGEAQVEGTTPQTAETPARSEKMSLNNERAVTLTGEDTAYEYGLTGRSQEELQNTLEESGIEMTDADRVSFTKGETQRKQNTLARVEYIRSLNRGEGGSRKGVLRSISAEEAKQYGVQEFKGVFSDKQRAAVDALRKVAEMMHINIVHFESPVVDGVRKGANGMYDSASNTVYVDLFAGQGNDQAVMRAAAHELTHVIQEWSPEKYTKLQDMLIKYYYSTGKNTLNEMIQAQKTKAAENGLELTESQALDEVTADACEMMFSDIDAMREIARTDKTLFEKIGEWINKFVDSIKTAMQGIRSSTKESSLLMESKETWENARKIWYQALEEAGQNNPGSIDQKAETAENVQKPVVKKADSVVKIENQPEKKSGKGVAYTADQKPIDYHYELVNAEDLIASNTTAFEVNEAYPQELQPRDRQRQASRDQVWNMARNLNPVRLGESVDVQNGAPIIGSDRVVESGNGRVLAVQLAMKYGEKSAKSYTKWLRENAENFGLDAGSVNDNSVLVRVRDSEVDRTQFVKDANESTTASYSESESAQSDSEKLTPEMLELFVPSETGRLDTRENHAFVTRFLDKVIPRNERASYVQQDGSISQRGWTRLRNAVFQRAYGSSQLTGALSEATEDGTKNVIRAMTNAAPHMVLTQEGVKKQQLYDVKLPEAMTEAARRYMQLKREGMDVGVYLSQMKMPGLEEESAGAQALMRMFDKYKGSTNQLTQALNTVMDVLEEYGEPNQVSMFGERVAPELADIVSQAQQRMDSGRMQYSLRPDVPLSAKQIDDNRSSVAKMEAVAQLAGDEFAIGDGKIKANVLSYWQKNYKGKVVNDVIGEVTLDKKGLKASVGHGMTKEKAAAYHAVPEILKYGKVVDYQKAWKGRQVDGVMVAAPITISGERYLAGVIVVRPHHTDLQRYYTHDVVIEKEGTASDGWRGTTTADRMAYLPMTSILQTMRNVKGEDAGSAVRFSMREPVETAGSLMAIHNLTEDKLKKTLELGGFPMPSIAITKPEIGHENFGNISLVFGRETVDPAADSRNDVYSADAWTPTYPEIDYEADDKVLSKLSKMYYKLARVHGYDAIRALYDYVNDIERQLKNVGGEQGMMQKLRDDTEMMQIFLADTGKSMVQPVMREKITRMSDGEISTARAVIAEIGEDAIRDMKTPEGTPSITHRKQWYQKNEAGLLKAFEKLLIANGSTEAEAKEMADYADRRTLMEMAFDARKYLNGEIEKRTQVEDRDATKQAIREATDAAAYGEWLQKMFGGIEKSTGIYNNKELYTPSGNRRSFSQTHYPVTLENIVRAMSGQNGGNTKNVMGFNGVKTLRAGTAKRFASIADMHALEGRLENLTEEQAEAINDQLSERLSNLMGKVLDLNPIGKYDNVFIKMDAIGEVLMEISESGKYDAVNVKKTFAKYQYKLNDETAKGFEELLVDIEQMPVNIFEAKPARVVPFAEVQVAILPDSISPQIKTKLESMGVRTMSYTEGNEAERKEALNSLQDLRFSQRDTEYKTDRQLLASALEGVTKNAEEAQMLREYQEIAAKLDADERRVQEINERIRELRLEDVNTPEEQQLLEERKGLEKGITTADRRLFQMERLQPLQRIAKIQRREAEEALQKARRHLERYKEGVIQREYIGKIKRTSDKLAKWLTKPNNQRYVPEDLRRPLAEFLLAIDRGSETMLTGGGMTQADRDYARVVADLRDVVSNISAYQNDQSESGKNYSMYIDLPRGFVEMMTEHARKMDAKAQEMGGRMTLNRMNAQELEELFMTLTAIASSITHTNDFLSTENAKRVGEVAQDTIGYLREQKPIVTESKIGEFLNWDNLQPIYAFERYGEGGKQIFRMLQDGQSKLAFNTQEIVKEAEKLYTAKEAKTWSEEIKTFTIGGKEVRIPVTNIMSLYCLMRRQQGIGHLYGEGIRVGDFKDGVKTVRDDGHNIGDADIARMVGSLTERQKDVAEKLQQVMSTKGSRWGNEISMKRFGYRMFTEKNYFPIEVDRTHLPARTDNGRGNELYRLLNISSTKPITRGANNRIMLNNIFDVFSSHMSDMAQYNAMALPVLDAVKWLNYKESEMEEVPIGEEKEYRQKYTESVRDAARDAYGYAANKYIIGVLRDINGAQMTGGEGYGKMMLGRVNRASVAANLRVAFLQPLSIIRAATVLKGTDILTGAGIGATHIKRNLKEMEEHSGIAVWKQLGFYDVNIGRSVSKLIKHDETSMDKLIDASMKGAEVADRMTWALMWEGAKRDVARTTSPSSEGFLDKVAERFEEVVYKTQVVDSVLTRSQYMRNPGFFAKWTSSFMSEPTTTYNMLLNAYSKFTTEARNTNFQKAWQKTGKMVFRTMAVYTVTAAINAIVESLMGAWRDEDDYKTFTEKFQDGYYDNLINNLMPFNKLPLISDVYEYAKKSLALFGVDTYGYGDTNVITQWLDQLYAGLEIVADKVNGDPTNYTEYGAIYKLMQGLSSLAGVPAASFMREVVAMWNNTGGRMTGRKIVVYKTSKSQGYQQMYNAIMDENTERTEQIRTELKENGAEDKNIISGLRSLAKQDYMAGNLTDDEAAAFLQKNCGMSADEAYWKLDEWAWDAEAEAEDYSVYNELEEALLTGTGIDAAVKRLTDHGYEKSKVQSKVRELVKAGYLAGDLTQTKVTSLLKAHGGLTDNEAYFKQQQYEYERLTGDSTSSDACMIFYEIDNKRSPAKTIDAALKHGKTKSGLASSLTSRYKEQYLELLKTNKSAAYQLATRLAGIFDYLGYDGTKKVQGWTETK